MTVLILQITNQKIDMVDFNLENLGLLYVITYILLKYIVLKYHLNR